MLLRRGSLEVPQPNKQALRIPRFADHLRCRCPQSKDEMSHPDCLPADGCHSFPGDNHFTGDYFFSNRRFSLTRATRHFISSPNQISDMMLFVLTALAINLLIVALIGENLLAVRFDQFKLSMNP